MVFPGRSTYNREGITALALQDPREAVQAERHLEETAEAEELQLSEDKCIKQLR